MKRIARIAGRGFGRMVVPLAMLALLATAPVASAQQSFKSAEDAAASLVDAAKAGDANKQLVEILGPEGAQIASSGDPVADASIRQRFVEAYAQKHSIVAEGDDKMIMIIGNEEFPFPIPIVRRNSAWSFDAKAGRLEILFRRIGRNELDAIQACLAYVDAQNEYAEKDRIGAGTGVYAQRIISHDGKKDGLYWPSAEGEEQSPLGDLVAKASVEGYRAGQERAPFHGYYYKVLTRQGPNAPGGELDYVVNGKMIGGFALIAYPAEYGSSGIMSFMVSHSGTVLEKDLGPQTSKIAERISSFDPDRTWRKVDLDHYR